MGETQEGVVRVVVTETTETTETTKATETTTTTTETIETTSAPSVPNTGENHSVNSAEALPALGLLAVLLLLAIGIVSATKKHAKNHKKSLSFLFSGAILAGLAFSGLTMPKANPTVVKATTSTTTTTPEISLSAPEKVEMSIDKASTLTAAGAHSLTIGTNSPTGYTLMLNSKTADTDLVSETTTKTIAATSGTFDSPATLAENTWGYSLDNTSYSKTTKWAGVTEDEVAIKTTDEAAEEETVKVYYAANVGSDLPAGTYEGTVVYTISPNLDGLLPPTIESFTPVAGTVQGGTTITIVGTNFTKNGSSITSEILIGGKACTDPIITADTPETGKDTIVCKVPEAPEGVTGTSSYTVPITVRNWVGEDTTTDVFEYTVSDVIYVSPDIATTSIESGSLGPAFTIGGDGFINEDNPVTSVLIGGNACESFTVVSNTQIVCTEGPKENLTSGNARVVVKHQYGSTHNEIYVTYSSDSYPLLSSDLTSYCTAEKKIAKDSRDNQLYYVARLGDGKCWIVDNLKYSSADATLALSQVSGKALTTTGTGSRTSAADNDVAKYVDPGTQEYCMNSTNMPGDTVTRCGFLYNWYAATAGSIDSSTTGAGHNATASICPAGFRLPSSYSGTSGPTTDVADDSFMLGSSYSTLAREYSQAADLPVLNASTQAGSVTTGIRSEEATSTETYKVFSHESTFSGVYAGAWGTNFSNTGRRGYYWSSTSANKKLNGGEVYRAAALYIENDSKKAFTGDGSYNDQRYIGLAVRCVEE